MKVNRNILLSLGLLILIAALYRVFPARPIGFAPQWAMAIFGGSVIRDKKFAFTLPVLSMFISDLLYQVLYQFNLSTVPGFYEGQIINYLLFAGLTIIGFWVKENKWKSILGGSLLSVTLYYLVSNFLVWSGGGGYQRPKTLNGLLLCYQDAIPFYLNSLLATVLFSGVLFGGYYWLKKYAGKKIARTV